MTHVTFLFYTLVSIRIALTYFVVVERKNITISVLSPKYLLWITIDRLFAFLFAQ